MRKPLDLWTLYGLAEPDIHLIDGPLFRGYAKMAAGDMSGGKALIADHYASVYSTRWHERTTEDYVRVICERYRTPMPINRDMTVRSTLLAAAYERVERENVPLFNSIVEKGYRPELGSPVTIQKKDGKTYVCDGKNRVSIAAALGYEVAAWEPVRYLTPTDYEANANNDIQWRSYKQRWIYHAAAIAEIVKLSPKKVLEIGTFGAQLVYGSETIDMPPGQWRTPWCAPSIVHDVRNVPWPVRGKYDLIVALRVWHHLAPCQREAFDEARRLAKWVLIVCPEKEDIGCGILKEQWSEWYGKKPEVVDDLGDWGVLYLFRGK